MTMAAPSLVWSGDLLAGDLKSKASLGFNCSFDDRHDVWPELEPEVFALLPLPMTQWIPPVMTDVAPQQSFVVPPMTASFFASDHPSFDSCSHELHWHRQPFVHILWLRYASQQDFKSDKARVRAWIQARESTKHEYLIVFCPPVRSKPSSSGGMTGLIHKISGLHVGMDSSLDYGANTRIFDRLLNDCVPGESSHRLIRLDAQEVTARRGAAGQGLPPLADRHRATIEEQWKTFRSRLHTFCYASLSSRVSAYQTVITRYGESRYSGKAGTGSILGWLTGTASQQSKDAVPWSFPYFFALKEGLAFVLCTVRLYGEALRLYDELEAEFTLVASPPQDLPQGLTDIRLAGGAQGPGASPRSHVDSLRTVPGLALMAPFLGTGTKTGLAPSPASPSTTAQPGSTEVSIDNSPVHALRSALQSAWVQSVHDAEQDAWAGLGKRDGSLPAHVLDMCDPTLGVARAMLASSPGSTLSLFDFRHYLFARQATLLVSLRRGAELTVRASEYLGIASDILAVLVAGGKVGRTTALAWLFCAAADLVETITHAGPTAFSHELDMEPDGMEEGEDGVNIGIGKARDEDGGAGTGEGGRGRSRGPSVDAYGGTLAAIDETSSVVDATNDPVGAGQGRARSGTLGLSSGPGRPRGHGRGRAASSVHDMNLGLGLGDEDRGRDGEDGDGSGPRHSRDATGSTAPDDNPGPRLALARHAARHTLIAMPVDITNELPRPASPGHGDATDSEFQAGMTAQQYTEAGGHLGALARLYTVTGAPDGQMKDGDKDRASPEAAVVPGHSRSPSPTPIISPAGGLAKADGGSASATQHQNATSGGAIASGVSAASQQSKIGSSASHQHVAHAQTRGTLHQPAGSGSDTTQTRLAACMAELLSLASTCLEAMLCGHSRAHLASWLTRIALTGSRHRSTLVEQVTPAPGGAHSAGALALRRALVSAAAASGGNALALDRLRLSLWFSSAHYHAAAGRLRVAVELDLRRACALVAHGHTSAALPLLLDLDDQIGNVRPALGVAQATCLVVAARAAAITGDAALPGLVWRLLHPAMRSHAIAVWAASMHHITGAQAIPPHALLATFPTLPSFLAPAGGLHAAWTSPGAQVKQLCRREAGIVGTLAAVQWAWMCAAYVALLQSSRPSIPPTVPTKFAARPTLSTAVALHGPGLHSAGHINSATGGQDAMAQLLTPRYLYGGTVSHVRVYVASTLAVPVTAAYVSVQLVINDAEDGHDKADPACPATTDNPHAIDPAVIPVAMSGESPKDGASHSPSWVRVGPSRSTAVGPSTVKDSVHHAGLPEGSSTAKQTEQTKGTSAGAGPSQPQRPMKIEVGPQPSSVWKPVVTHYTGSGNAASHWEPTASSKTAIAGRRMQVHVDTTRHKCTVSHMARIVPDQDSSKRGQGKEAVVSLPGKPVVVCPGVTALHFTVPMPHLPQGTVRVASVTVGLGEAPQGSTDVPMVLEDDAPLMITAYSLEQLLTAATLAEQAVQAAQQKARAAQSLPQQPSRKAPARDEAGRLVDFEQAWSAADVMGHQQHVLKPAVLQSKPNQATPVISSSESSARSDDGADMSAVSVDSEDHLFTAGVARHGSGVGPAPTHAVHPFRGPRPAGASSQHDETPAGRGLVSFSLSPPGWLRVLQGVRFVAKEGASGPGPASIRALFLPCPYFPAFLGQHQSDDAPLSPKPTEGGDGSATPAMEGPEEQQDGGDNGGDKAGHEAAPSFGTGLEPWAALASPRPSTRDDAALMARDHAARVRARYPAIPSAAADPIDMALRSLHDGQASAQASPLSWFQPLGTAIGTPARLMEPPSPLHLWLASDPTNPMLVGCRHDLVLLATPGMSLAGRDGLAKRLVRLFIDLPADLRLACLEPGWTWPHQPGRWPVVHLTSREVGLRCSMSSAHVLHQHGHVGVGRPHVRHDCDADVLILPSEPVVPEGSNKAGHGSGRTPMRVSITLQSPLPHGQYVVLRLPVIPLAPTGPSSTAAGHHRTGTAPSSVEFRPVLDPSVAMQGVSATGMSRIRQDELYSHLRAGGTGQTVTVHTPPLARILRLGVSADVLVPMPQSATPRRWSVVDPALPVPLYHPLVAHVQVIPKANVHTAVAVAAKGTRRRAHHVPGWPDDVAELLWRILRLTRDGAGTVLARVPGAPSASLAPVLMRISQGMPRAAQRRNTDPWATPTLSATVKAGVEPDLLRTMPRAIAGAPGPANGAIMDPSDMADTSITGSSVDLGSRANNMGANTNPFDDDDEDGDGDGDMSGTSMMEGSTVNASGLDLSRLDQDARDDEDADNDQDDDDGDGVNESMLQPGSSDSSGPPSPDHGTDLGDAPDGSDREDDDMDGDARSRDSDATDSDDGVGARALAALMATAHAQQSGLPTTVRSSGSALVLVQLTVFLPVPFVVLDVELASPHDSGWSMAAGTAEAIRGSAVEPLAATWHQSGRATAPPPTLLLLLFRFRRTMTASVSVRARLRVDFAVPSGLGLGTGSFSGGQPWGSADGDGTHTPSRRPSTASIGASSDAGSVDTISSRTMLHVDRLPPHRVPGSGVAGSPTHGQGKESGHHEAGHGNGEDALVLDTCTLVEDVQLSIVPVGFA